MPEQNPQTEDKVVFEFQHTDESGNPILDPRTGKPAFTNLVGTDYKEIADKLKDSYLNVTRAYTRAKNHKPVAKAPEPVRQQISPEQERQLVAEVQDPTKAKEAIRKLAGTDQIEGDRRIAQEKQDAADAQKAAFLFMSNHIDDYFRCKANSDLISKFITDNDLDPRAADNYEIAFNSVQSNLAQKPAPVAAAPPPPPEPPPPPKKANGGIEPGSLSGARPSGQRRERNDVTREEINKLRSTPQGREEYRRRMRTESGFQDKVNAAYARQT